jgi:hypothetical protein
MNEVLDLNAPLYVLRAQTMTALVIVIFSSKILNSPRNFHTLGGRWGWWAGTGHLYAVSPLKITPKPSNPLPSNRGGRGGQIVGLLSGG